MKTATQTIHPWEAAGLGRAPFRLLGAVDQNISYGERVLGHVAGATLTTKPGGTCAVCGHAITVIYEVESADGNRFPVGCDCVLKLNDAAMGRQVRTHVNRIQRERSRAKKVAQEAADRVYVAAFDLDRVRHIPHPITYRAERGETLADWALWCMSVGLHRNVAAKLRSLFPRD